MSETTTGLSVAPCGYCGAHHSGTCSRIASIEYHPNGTLKRVTFHEATIVASVTPPFAGLPWRLVHSLAKTAGNQR